MYIPKNIITHSVQYIEDQKVIYASMDRGFLIQRPFYTEWDKVRPS